LIKVLEVWSREHNSVCRDMHYYMYGLGFKL